VNDSAEICMCVKLMLDCVIAVLVNVLFSSLMNIIRGTLSSL
jgi:hypothetical protein